MNRKSIYIKILPILLCATLFTGCGTDSKPPASTETKTSANTKTQTNTNAGAVKGEMVTYENADFYSDWKNETPNYIELSGTKATVKGSGAVVNGSKITITAAGIYAITGKLDNGQIVVDVKDKATVKRKR